jgi:5-methylcytosine-specific restriction endonuclease McrBC GTP-binding regulatory subunit McrB
MTYENMNWVFLKNEASLSCGPKSSYRQKKRAKKELSTSIGGIGSDNASIDSQNDMKGHNTSIGLNDFDDIIIKHFKKEDPTIADDLL